MTFDPKRTGNYSQRKVLNEATFKKEWNKLREESLQEHDFIKGHNENKNFNDTHETFEDFKRRQKVLLEEAKLKLILLYYLFTNDDGRIDRNEKIAMKKFISSFKSSFTKTMFNELVSSNYSIDTQQGISLYLEHSNISKERFSILLNEVKEITQFEDKYSSLIDELKFI